MKTESRIQQEIFQWYWNNYCLPSCQPREIIYHVPNEGRDKGRLISVGLVPGVSDLVMTYRGQHYYIEIKTPDGKQRPSQIKFQQHIGQVGCRYEVIRSLEDFKNFIQSLA